MASHFVVKINRDNAYLRGLLWHLLARSEWQLSVVLSWCGEAQALESYHLGSNAGKTPSEAPDS